MNSFSQHINPYRTFFSFGNHFFQTFLFPITIAYSLGNRLSEPAKRIGSNLYKICDSYMLFHCPEKNIAFSVNRISYRKSDRNDTFFHYAFEHLRRQLRFCFENNIFGKLRFFSFIFMLIIEPDFGNEQSFIRKSIPLRRCVSRKNAHLTVFNFPQTSAILPRHSG